MIKGFFGGSDGGAGSEVFASRLRYIASRRKAIRKDKQANAEARSVYNAADDRLDEEDQKLAEEEAFIRDFLNKKNAEDDGGKDE